MTLPIHHKKKNNIKDSIPLRVAVVCKHCQLGYPKKKSNHKNIYKKKNKRLTYFPYLR